MSDVLLSPDPWLAEQTRLFDGCRRRWSSLHEADDVLVRVWQESLERMSDSMRAQQLAGRWVRGSADLLSIVGLNRWELAHSAALSWLLDPFGTHGLGTRFLTAFANQVGADIDASERIELRVEEARVTTRGEITRADVVVAAETWTLVVEVKVDALEGPRQAARLHECWAVDPQPTFVFLTRAGAGPKTVDDACRDTWVPLSWRWVAQCLQASVAAHDAPPTALVEYVRTLKGMFG